VLPSGSAKRAELGGDRGEQIDRRTLPILEPKHETITGFSTRDAKAPPSFKLEAPKGALKPPLLDHSPTRK
jgi:hypothetical protein